MQFNHIVVVSGAGSLGLGMVAAARQKVDYYTILYDVRVLESLVIMKTKAKNAIQYKAMQYNT